MTLYDVAPLEGYDPQVGLLLASLSDSTREWRENLEGVTQSAITWQLTPDSYSIGGLILHIIDVEDYWFRSFCAELERDPAESELFLSEATNQYGGQWPVPPNEPIEWYYALHDRIRTRAWDAIRDIDPARVYERPARNYSCTFRWVLAHVLEHDSYHGGQAVAMLELWKKMAG